MMYPFKIHSAYNPQKEAQRFCNEITTQPKIIVITEPGESYLVPVLREKFPTAKLIAIRYTDNHFLDSDKMWDSVWRPVSGNLEFFIIRNIPDEFLPASIFLPWKPAERIWSDSAKNVWKSISEAIKIMQSIIATRDFFGKRWYKNIVNNFLTVNNTVNFNFTNEDSFLLASGPSMNNSLKNIKTKLSKMFSIAVGSATPALLARNIKPNLCISTDGSFWAANHLKNIPKDIPLAFPAEANIPLKILKENNCLFLNYGSTLETFFLNKFHISSKIAKRNGTVSGTSTDFLLDYTHGNIFIGGLDLRGTKGFSHIQPYEGQKSKENNFNKLYPVSNFTAVSNFDCRSLNTYAKWFSQITTNRAKRLSRLKHGGCRIKNIKTITEDEFILNAKNWEDKLEIQYDVPLENIDKKEQLNIFYKNLKTEIESEQYFNKLKKHLSKNYPDNLNNNIIETDLCELISFHNYIQYIKELFSNNEQNLKTQKHKLKIRLSDFIEEQMKRLKYE